MRKRVYDILESISKKHVLTNTDVVKDKCMDVYGRVRMCTDVYGRNVTTCVSCGDIIPEGFQVCKACIARVNNK